MRALPILFSAPMVRAILEERKTQTRRVVKPALLEKVPRGGFNDVDQWKRFMVKHAARVHVGDRLWVKETWQQVMRVGRMQWRTVPEIKQFEHDDFKLIYAATCPDGEHPPRWRSSIHMPRWASRISLRVTGVRCDRLQEISEEDVDREGVFNASGLHLAHCGFTVYHPDQQCGCGDKSPQEEYALLWDRINGKTHPWASNPWVWVYEFAREE